MFPEFSSGFLGETTIETLNETKMALEDAGNYFIGANTLHAVKKVGSTGESGKSQDADNVDGATSTSPGPGSKNAGSRRNTHWKLRRWLGKLRGDEPTAVNEGKAEQPPVTMTDLAATKAKIRRKLEDCKAAQQECNFELAVSVLPPRDIKPISNRAMKKLVANTIAVIGACESRFALVGEEETKENSRECDDADKTQQSDSHKQEDSERLKPPTKHRLLSVFDSEDKKEEEESGEEDEKAELEAIKPKREIEFGDVRLLRYLTSAISKPYQNLYQALDRTVQVIEACVTYVYVTVYWNLRATTLLTFFRMYQSFQADARLRKAFCLKSWTCMWR